MSDQGRPVPVINAGHHGKPRDDMDFVDQMLERTGCSQAHYDLQDCMFETRDWRKCQEKVEALKLCMRAYEVRKQQTGS